MNVSIRQCCRSPAPANTGLTLPLDDPAILTPWPSPAKKQDIRQAALRLLKEYGVPQKELQACGMVCREESTEVNPDYLAIATRRHLVLVHLKDWSNQVPKSYYFGESYLLDDLRLIEARKAFLTYYLTFDISRVEKDRYFLAKISPFFDVKDNRMLLSASWRPSWVNYEELALYLMKRVQKK